MLNIYNFLTIFLKQLLDLAILWILSYEVIFLQNWLLVNIRQFLIKSFLQNLVTNSQITNLELLLYSVEQWILKRQHKLSFMFLKLKSRKSLDKEDFLKISLLVFAESHQEEELCFPCWDPFSILMLHLLILTYQQLLATHLSLMGLIIADLVVCLAISYFRLVVMKIVGFCYY